MFRIKQQQMMAANEIFGFFSWGCKGKAYTDPLKASKITFFNNFLQEHYQSVKRVDSRSGPTFCRF